MTTRRDILRGSAALATLSTVAPIAAATAAEADPLLALVAQWEPLFIKATHLEMVLSQAGDEMEKMGFLGRGDAVALGNEMAFRSVEEIAGYCAGR